MANSKRPNRGRRFAMLEHRIMEHDNYIALSFPARCLLDEFIYQYRGKNNGDLCCAFAVLKPRGWRSETTIKAAAKELLNRGFIVKTRQGGRNRPNLYGLTFHAIDECGGKLDIAATRGASHDWQTQKAS